MKKSHKILIAIAAILFPIIIILCVVFRNDLGNIEQRTFDKVFRVAFAQKCIDGDPARGPYCECIANRVLAEFTMADFENMEDDALLQERFVARLAEIESECQAN